MSRAYRVTWVTVGQTVSASDRMKVPVAIFLGDADPVAPPDTNGRVAQLSVRMDEWWQHAIERAIGGDEVGRYRLGVTFELEPFDEPLHIEPPCIEPSTDVDDETGLDVLVCPA